MIQLSTIQVSILKTIANGKPHFVAFSSIKADGKAAAVIDEVFEEALNLVANGLLYNVSDVPKFKKIVDEYKEEEDRTLFILAPTEAAKKMFKRNSWQGWIN